MSDAAQMLMTPVRQRLGHCLVSSAEVQCYPRRAHSSVEEHGAHRSRHMAPAFTRPDTLEAPPYQTRARHSTKSGRSRTGTLGRVRNDDRTNSTGATPVSQADARAERAAKGWRSPPRRVDSVDGKPQPRWAENGTLDPARVRRIYSAGTNLSANPFMQ